MTTLLIIISLSYQRGGHNGVLLYTSSSSPVRFPKSDSINLDRVWPLTVAIQPPPSHRQTAAQVSSVTTGTKGYLLALYVLEQLTMSSAHYISLMNIANSWGLSGVEPTICHSRMYALPGIADMCHPRNTSSNWQQPNTDEVEYGRLFNLSDLNNRLVKCLNVSNSVCETKDSQHRSPCTRVVDSLDDFVRLSYRRIVLVHFVRGIGGSSSRTPFLPHDKMRYFERSVVQALEQQPIVDCSHKARNFGIASTVENMLNKFVPTSASVFLVQRTLCVNKDLDKDGVNITKLMNSIFRFKKKSNISVIFTKWQNRGIFGPGSETLSRCKISPIPHSNEVNRESKRFISKVNIHNPFIAVHLRLERLYQCEALIPGYTKCCVERLSSLLEKVRDKYDINKKDVLIVKDYGPYGTDSCTYQLKYMNVSICLNLTQDFLTHLKQHGYHASEFIPSEYGSDIPDNSGFVSLVEAGALLSGSILIAGGFGSYQGTVIKQFLGIDDPNVGFKHFDNKHDFGSPVLYDRLYRVCTCSPLKGHNEKLNGINLGTQSCDSNTLVPSSV